MDAQAQTDTAPVVLRVIGDFSFALNREFQRVLQAYPRGEHAFEVDLTGVKQLDASALGMLLKLRDHSRDGCQLILRNPSPAARAALQEAEVGKLLRTG
jgi:anti-anti-sigma regulatory factor